MLKGNLIKIAIIDDDEDDYFIIADYIKEIRGAHLETTWLKDYKTAIDAIKAQSYHVYMIDYRLGRETGLQLLREAIDSGCEQPIIVLTGKGNKEIDIQAMLAGATDYLIKSELNTEKLERCIRYSIDRAATLKALKEREYKYRNLFKGSKDTVLITDDSLNITEANNAASLLFGQELEDLVGRNLCDFINDTDKRELLHKSIEGKFKLSDLALDIVNANKESRSCLLSLVYQKDVNDKWIVHGILHDITAMKKVEQANLQAEKLASNEKLMRVIAHEIRNPLNNIALSTEHLEFASGDMDFQTELISIIKRNCVRIDQSITELLNITKTAELDFRKHSLQEIMDESIATVADRISLRNIKVEKKFSEDPLEILADKPKLKIAFSNILINAIEAMNEKENDAELAVSLHPSSQGAMVCIQDNGVGIAEEYLPNLFEPFFTRKKNGLGLGLAASYSILQSHKASIQVESKVNQGSNFIITF